jgi:hypothetical protein
MAPSPGDARSVCAREARASVYPWLVVPLFRSPGARAYDPHPERLSWTGCTGSEVRVTDVDAVIDAHIAGFWPGSLRETIAWNYGPIWDVLPRFRVIRVSPRSPREPWVYVTRGAWTVGREATRLEFLLQSPVDELLHVELLSMVAHLHADDRHRLDVGHTMNVGRPWLPGSSCDHLLVSLPYPYGPKLEWCEVQALRVRFLWLLPITKSERDHRVKHGLEALEQLFDAAAIDSLDPKRVSVV